MKLLYFEVPEILAEPVRACKEHLRLAAILSALVNILYLAPTIYMMQVYDRVVSTGGVLTLLWLTLMVAYALGTLALLDAVRARVLMRAGLRLDRIMASTVLDRILRQPSRNTAIPTTAQALRDFDCVRAAFAGPPAIALLDIPWTPIYILVAFLLHPILGAFVTLSAALLLALAIVNERNTRVGTKAASRALSGSYAMQERITTQAEVVRALGMRRAMVNIQLEERRRALEMTRETLFLNSRMQGQIKFLRLFLQSAALGTGAWLAVEHMISAGAIIAASVLISRTLQPIEQLVGSWKSILEALQAQDNLQALFEATSTQQTDLFRLPPPKGKIACEHVSVAGPFGTALLNNISFTANAGEMIGIIGPSGAGKSTLLRVLAGAIATDRGNVRIDGAEIHDWDPEELARHIGYLPQDCSLMPGTIADNISRFAKACSQDWSAIDKAVLEAAEIARVHEDIVKLPGGYDMRIGWNGEGLSAGQRQRIALARAVYGNPSILIMDEPNASLDGPGEAALTATIEVLQEKGVTLLVAAHRQAILASATSLLVLMDGSIRMFGPAAEISAQLNPRGGKLVEVKAV